MTCARAHATCSKYCRAGAGVARASWHCVHPAPAARLAANRMPTRRPHDPHSPCATRPVTPAPMRSPHRRGIFVRFAIMVDAPRPSPIGASPTLERPRSEDTTPPCVPTRPFPASRNLYSHDVGMCVSVSLHVQLSFIGQSLSTSTHSLLYASGSRMD